MKNSVLKTALISFSALLIGAAHAQAQDHAGHDHSEHKHETPAADIDIDHVFDEAADDHTVGSEIAPVSMIIYASVTCPHCGDWFTNHWPDFKKDHVDNGDVRIVFREFPTAPAQLSMAGFLIANCAADDGFFDHMVHQMQSQEAIFEAVKAGNGKATYDELGKKAGLNTEEDMTACFSKNENFDRIQRSMTRAQAGGISGVPAFIIDGEIYKGDVSAEKLSELVISKTESGMTPIPGR